MIDAESDDSTEVDALPPQLTDIELRVLGSLMEKQLTTPDQYPLTINAILTACNQKSSREPITNYQQGEVVRTLTVLEDKRFVRRELGSRADKYSQQFMHHLELSKKHQAVLCLMMLRGPQTVSELVTRTQRMALFADRDELIHCLERLCERALPVAIRLSNQPGQRGERFVHLFCRLPGYTRVQSKEVTPGSTTFADQGLPQSPSVAEFDDTRLDESVAALRLEVAELKHQLETLYALTGHSRET